MTQPAIDVPAALSPKYNPYPDYKSSGVDWLGDIPAHWTILRLKRMCNNITDGSHNSPPTQDTGKYYVTVRNLIGDQIDLASAAKISDQDFELLDKNGCRPQVGDILLSKDGTIGRAAIASNDNYVVLSSLAILRPNKNTQSAFLRYFLVSKAGVGQMLSWIAGAALKRITLDQIVNLVSVFPPLPEQRAIAAFLDRETSHIDALINKKQALISLLQEKRTALIFHTVTRGLDHSAPLKASGVEWLGNIPAHWKTARLKYLGWFAYGDSLAADKREDGEVPVYGSNGVVGTHMVANTLAPALIIGRKGSYGKVNYSEVPCFAIDTTYFIDSRYAKADLRWLFYLLPLLKLDAYSQDSAVPGLSREHAHNQFVPYTSVSEQHDIATFLDRGTTKLDALTGKLEDHLTKLHEYRTALISAAVTGKIDVRAQAP